MGEYLFILGKNHELSTAEIVAYLESRNVDFSIADHTEMFVIVSADGLPKDMPSDLGGIIKFGEVLSSGGNVNEIINSLDEIDIGADFPEKGLFVVSSYGAGSTEEIGRKLKARLKSMGLKAGLLKHNSPTVSHTEVVRRGLEGREFLLCKGGGWWFGRTTTAHNPFEFQKRDVKRPEQRVKLSMPPRLARIMLNMSGLKGKGKVLDPLCGLGTIPQEGVLMGYVMYGSDVDEEAVKACKDNMKWLKQNYDIKPPEIARMDARRLSWPDGHFDAIVTEPVLGPPLKSYPKIKQAEAIVRKLEPLYRDSIKELVRVLKTGGRLVMTSPMFRVHNEIYRIDIEAIAKEAGASEIDPLEGRMQHDFPLNDFEDRHRTLREVHILVKG
ncbi:MAG: hypothetical protein ABIH90_01465 [Candidatus Aenigmatarchaeota archaeon]